MADVFWRAELKSGQADVGFGFSGGIRQLLERHTRLPYLAKIIDFAC
jgi:hypothetical protein